MPFTTILLAGILLCLGRTIASIVVVLEVVVRVMPQWTWICCTPTMLRQTQTTTAPTTKVSSKHFTEIHQASLQVVALSVVIVGIVHLIVTLLVVAAMLLLQLRHCRMCLVLKTSLHNFKKPPPPPMKGKSHQAAHRETEHGNRPELRVGKV